MTTQSNVIQIDSESEQDTDEGEHLRPRNVGHSSLNRYAPTNTTRELRNASPATPVHLSPLLTFQHSPQGPSTLSDEDLPTIRLPESAPQRSEALKISKKEQRKAAAEAKRLQQDRQREERAAAKQTKDIARVRQAFSNAEESGTFRLHQVELVVSPQLFNTTTRKDVLSHVRTLFPHQICCSDFDLHNLVTWRTKTNSPSLSSGPSNQQSKNASMCLAVFSGIEYWNMMMNRSPGGSLFSVAQELLTRRQGDRIFYAIYGIEAECKRRRNLAARQGSKAPVVTLQAVQDSYTALYMDYGIRTQAFVNASDAGKYILELTNAIVDKPYYHQDDFLDASLAYRDARKKLSNRSTVISLQEVTALQGTNLARQTGSGDEEYGQNPDVAHGQEDTTFLVPIMRSEGSLDLGYMYLAFLALVPRMSFEKAISIRRAYPTFSHLQEAFSRCSTLEERHSLLANLRYEPNNRRFGPALSKALAIVFTSSDWHAPFRL